MVFASSSLPPTLSCGYCNQPPRNKNPHPKPPSVTYPPYTTPPHKNPPFKRPPPVTRPPVVISPPVINPPPTYTYPPYTVVIPPPPSPPSSTGKCSADVLKLGLCVDVLGGLVHIGLGDPVQNTCCPVLQGLVELEAAVCLCTAIRLKVLNLNIYIPLMLNVLLTCGKTPPPDYVCSL
ncbi:36.4 kDa proline-rich protein [Acorus gramineus]|uniref:36.4 kDa proline-rich protein n=1 Tax=Acorus gramineus TaxID=55184 RepID=A0AAV9B9Z0_ACOGR|nr:36.4 kDa proline-rich protein [Acorus gramineus]